MFVLYGTVRVYVTVTAHPILGYVEGLQQLNDFQLSMTEM